MPTVRIPKSFNSDDFESLLLTSLLGVFVSLREDIISYKQAESFWLNELTAELFNQLALSDEIVELIELGIQLRQYEQYSTIYYQQIDRLIDSNKELINRYYTEYEQTSGMLS